MNIDEVIANAKAEEEANMTLLTAEKADSMETWQNEKAPIPISSLLVLSQANKDFNRLLDIIVASLELSYNGKDLAIRDAGAIVEAMKALYPHLCQDILEDLQEREGE